MNTYSRDETEFGAFGDSFGLDARTANFDTGATNLQPITGKAPALTAAQLVRSTAGRAAFNANTAAAAAARTSVINAPYTKARAIADEQARVLNNKIASDPAMLKGTGAWNFAGQDYGLLPAAAKLIVPLIATAATGGLAAPSVAAAAKGLGSAKATIASGDIKGTVSLVKQADALLSKAEAGVKDAKAVIDNTVKAAAAGIPDAKNGLALLVKVDAARVASGVPDGTPAFLPAGRPDRAVAPRAVQTSIAAGFTGQPPTGPKYLVLDSGQVLANELARQVLPGWLVQFNGTIVRQ